MRFLVNQLQRHRRLPKPPPFPAPETADAQGCVALGPRLTPDMILEAYRAGIFPMAEPDGSYGWWCPDPRTVIELDALHVPRRLAQTLRQGGYEVRTDTACAEVIGACADRATTWISDEIAEVYLRLHAEGFVHSIETWRGGRLVGGLYGVAVGGAFMAESMFHRERDMGKAALVALAERLRDRGFLLLDIQYETKATSVFRPMQIPRVEYLRRLRAALEVSPRFS
ncbi:MAG: leucyl/phenylalanyl-tRNA--protein transferase [Planctomycetota bacterium]